VRIALGEKLRDGFHKLWLDTGPTNRIMMEASHVADMPHKWADAVFADCNGNTLPNTLWLDAGVR